MNTTLQPAVFGATGYSGFELVRLLARHAGAKKPMLVRRNGESGGVADLSEAYPQLAGNGGFPFETFSWQRMKDAGVDVIFFATPHEFSRELVPEAIEQGFRVIDLSGAWRLKQADNRKVYGFEEKQPKRCWTAPLFTACRSCTRTKSRARRCWRIPAAMRPRSSWRWRPGFAPAMSTSSTASSAIRSPAFPEQGRLRPRTRTLLRWTTILSAYSVFGHRHSGEVLEQLGIDSGSLQFTPHLLPIPRGILSTIYVKLAYPVAAEELEQSLREFYAGKPWVRIFGAARLPQIKFSLNTNYCDIGFSLSPDGKRAVLVSCFDNLLKGAAGQAVQNMNLMFGFNEKEGLQ